MAAGERRSQVEKFSGKNFNLWIRLLQLWLMELELWLVIEREPPIGARERLRPLSQLDADESASATGVHHEARGTAAASTAAVQAAEGVGQTGLQGQEEAAAVSGELKEWLDKDAKARAQICWHLKTTELHLVIDCKSAREMWLALRNHFQGQSKLEQHQLRLEWEQARMKPGERVNEFYGRLRMIASELQAAGKSVAEDEIIDRLASGVSSEFNVTVEAQLASQRCTLESLVSALLSKETWLARQTARDSTEVRFVGNRRGRSISEVEEKGGYSKNSNFRGTDDRSYGRKLPSGSGKGQRSEKGRRREPKSTDVCHKCSGLGHWAKDCKEETATVRAVGVKRCAEAFYLDSGACEHMVACGDFLEDYRQLSRRLNLADGSPIQAVGVGNLCIGRLELKNVLHVPSLNGALIAIGALVDDGLAVDFGRRKAVVKDAAGNVVAVAARIGQLYRLVGDSLCKVMAEHAPWHARLGHPGEWRSKALKQAVDGVTTVESPENCKVCYQAKGSAEAIGKGPAKRASIPLQLVHSDIYGPLPVESPSGYRYLVTFVDDFSRYAWIAPLKEKSDAAAAFKKFVRDAKVETGNRVRSLRSGSVGEYVGVRMQDVLRKENVKHFPVAP